MTSPTLEIPQRISSLTGAGSWGSSPRQGSRRRPAPEPRIINAAQVAARLRALRAAGMTHDQIVQQSRLGEATIRRLISGRTRSCTVATAVAVARVRPVSDRTRSGLVIDSTGTRRRLGDLMLRGWTLAAIGAAADVNRIHLARVLTSTRVSLGLAERIRLAHEHLSNRAPDTSTRAAAVAAARARNSAAKAGNVPLDHWQPDDVDDPAVDADPHARRPAPRGKLVWVEDVEELASQGATWPEVIRRVGASHATISKSLERAGRYDVMARITRNSTYGD